MASHDDSLGPIPDFPVQKEGMGAKAIGMLDLTTEVVGSFLPGVGTAKDLLLEKYVRGPLERRRVAYHERIAEGLARLEARFEHFDPAKLAENEDFISVVFETTQIAMRTSREEKRQFLVNAVLNVASGITLDDVIQAAFVQLIGRFSGHHVVVLKAYQNPASLAHLLPDPRASVHAPMKELLSRQLTPNAMSEDALTRIHDDLQNEGMIAVYGVSGEISSTKSLLSPIGERFLAFISNPAD